MSNIGMPVIGRWEPSISHQLLSRCANCHAPHPMARRPAVESAACPDCGHPAAPPADQVKASATGGLWLWLANQCHSLARWLLKITERI